MSEASGSADPSALLAIPMLIGDRIRGSRGLVGDIEGFNRPPQRLRHRASPGDGGLRQHDGELLTAIATHEVTGPSKVPGQRLGHPLPALVARLMTVGSRARRRSISLFSARLARTRARSSIFRIGFDR